MKHGHSRTLFILGAIFLYGCGNAPIANDTTSANTNPVPKTLAAITPELLGGEWRAVFHCSGLDYVLDTRLRLNGGQLQATINGQAAQALRQVTRGQRYREQTITANYSGTLDTETGIFSLSSRDQVNRLQAPSFQGVFVPEEKTFAAELGGRQWQKCSHAMIVPKTKVKKITDKFAVKNKKVSASLFSALSMRGAVKAKNICSKDNVEWLNRYFASLPANSTRFDPTPYVEEMYRDGIFKSLFGRSLYKLNDKDSQILYTQITRASACEKLSDNARQQWRYSPYLVSALMNVVEHPRNKVLLNLLAKDNFRAWHARTEKLLVNQQSVSPEVAEQRLLNLPILKKAIDHSNKIVTPYRSTQLNTVYEETQQQWSAVVFESYLSKALAAKQQTPQALIQLINLPNRFAPYYGVLNTNQKTNAQQRINDKTATIGSPVLLTMIENTAGLNNTVALKNWQQIYHPIASRISSENRRVVDSAVAAKIKGAVNTTAQQYTAQYQAQVLSQPSSLATLAASVNFEQGIEKDLVLVLTEAPIKQLKRLTQQHRQSLMNDHSSSLTVIALQQDSVAELNNLQNRYLWPKDGVRPETQELLAAVSLRRQQLAPFNNAGDAYLNALYGRDFEALASLDAEFIQPYKNIFSSGAMSGFGALMDGIAGMAGFKTNIMQGMQADLATSSLIVPVFAIYLVDYQYKYKACLTSDAVRFKKTTSSETVYKDGWGNYQYSVPHPDTVEYFTVNRRFAKVFDAVGLNEADSPLAQFADSFMGGGNNRISAKAIVSGTRKMMDSYACDSPVIKQMETRMLDYFAIYQARKRKAKAAYFK